MPGLRVAVIGVGHLGRHHARIYHELPGVELVALVDPAADPARQLAAEYGVGYCTDIAQLDAPVDAVSIVVPTKDHFAVAAPLLERGVHVLLEKPMTSTLEQAQQLVEIARRSGAILQIGHIERFNPAVIAVERVLRSPGYIECSRISPYPFRSTDVGVVLDLMIHDLDIVLHLASSELQRIEAIGVAVLSESEDIANARLEFASGCVANLTASRVSIKSERKIRIFQPDAYVSLDYQSRQAVIYRPSADFAAKRHQLMHVPREAIEQARAAVFGGLLHVEHIQMGDEEPLRAEIASFVECVREGKRPVVSGEDGCRAVAAAMGILDHIRARGIQGPGASASA